MNVDKHISDTGYEFSIVLPVRNGGEYIKICINSILAQTVTNFNIHILENCSTDDTPAYLKSLTDPRISVHPATASLSIEKNWERILSIKRNKFMIIIGHDDYMYPGYLAAIKNLIYKYPDASLYQTHFNFIDERGEIVRNCKPMQAVQTVSDFFTETIENGGGFMMRSTDYDAVGGIPMYPNLFFADFALWLKLSRLSYKASDPGMLFSYRVHDQNTSAVSADEKYHAGFELFVNYLQDLKKEDKEFSEALNMHAINILSIYCKGLSHRLLRTPLKERNNLTVATVLKKYQGYADRLIDNNHFNFSKIRGMQLAGFIDSNMVTRNVFLLLKKLYPKPFVK